jgi:hypothetical protein
MIMNDKLLDYVNRFNNGEWEDYLSPIFGGNLKQFLTLLKRKGMLDMIALDSISREEPELLNEVMLDLLSLDKEYFLPKIVQEFLSDVEIRSDGYYLRLRDLSELAEFFKDDRYSRDYNPRSVAENVLGEDWWEAYNDTVHDVYRDIIEVLNDKNLRELATRIIELIGNQELSLDDYSSELFEELSDDNGNFIITESNVMEIIKDEDSMNQLFNGELNDLKNQLSWLGDNAYNNAYNDMVYKQVWSALSELFEGNHTWEEKKRSDGRVVHTPYIKIRDLYSDIVSFLNAFKGYNDNLYDYGDYTSFKTLYMDSEDEWLNLGRINDYPDQDDVESYINDGLVDRLY